MGQLEHLAIQRVGFKYAGAGGWSIRGCCSCRLHVDELRTPFQAFADQIMRAAKGEDSERDAHNRFYDEYLAVMDMTAEFYLSTVERIFKNREIARNEFTVDGKKVDIGAITDVAVKTVEGAKDDISAPGQCVAALKLLTGLPTARRPAIWNPAPGHYGIFAGQKLAQQHPPAGAELHRRQAVGR
jgi:poly(3-hydroxybutyrate) depolymerase